jgi:hypothetical protein
LLPSATCHPRSTSDHGTPVQSTPPLGSLRIVSMTLRAAARPGADAKRGVMGKLRSNDRIALGPRGWRRGAQGFGAARVSALRQLTSRRLSERSGQRPRSEFGARPQNPSTAEQSATGRPPPSGRLFFGDFLLAKQKKVTALSGAHPDAASRSEQTPRKSRARLRYLRPNGMRHANKASTSSARTGANP